MAAADKVADEVFVVCTCDVLFDMELVFWDTVLFDKEVIFWE